MNKKLYTLTIYFATFFLSLFTCSLVLARDKTDFVPGEVIIMFKPNVTSLVAKKIVESIGGAIKGKVVTPKAKIYKVAIKDITYDGIISTSESINQSSYKDKIIAVEPNLKRYAQRGGNVSTQSLSNDAYLGLQWGYFDINAGFSMASTTTTPTVAIIDTGVDYTHIDLVGKVIKGPDYVNADTDPMDDMGHGTHVAGIIAAKPNNSFGIAGVAGYSKVLAIKVLDSSGSGTTFDIVQGITYAANNTSVKIVNMSLGGYTPSQAELTAVDYLVNTKGKLLIAAAGNDDVNTKLYPAGYATDFPNKVIAVAAHGNDHCKAPFSNYGSWVSISAPGKDIFSTYPVTLGEYEYLSGTSMATPFVAAAAALVWGKNPSFMNEQIGQLLTSRTSLSTLHRDGTCWPNDGSTFQMLNLMHLLENDVWETEKFFIVYGIAMDAETGLPLTGAKITSKTGFTLTGSDIVPYYGKLIHPYQNDVLLEYYGLFSLAVRNDSMSNNTINISKKKYGSFSTSIFWGIGFENIGFIPIPPSKPSIWLTITWEPSYSGPARYDSFVYTSQADINFGYNYPGSLVLSPYVRFLWDSDSAYSPLQANSETIRIAKYAVGETYRYYIEDWGTGAGSTEWLRSGIKAYIWKWRGTKPILVNIVTPPTGAGGIWIVCDISGSSINIVNSLVDY